MQALNPPLWDFDYFRRRLSEKEFKNDWTLRHAFRKMLSYFFLSNESMYWNIGNVLLVFITPFLLLYYWENVLLCPYTTGFVNVSTNYYLLNVNFTFSLNPMISRPTDSGLNVFMQNVIEKISFGKNILGSTVFCKKKKKKLSPFL